MDLIRNDELQIFFTEMDTAMPLAKCQKCGCMHETLDALTAALPNLDAATSAELTVRHAEWSRTSSPIRLYGF